MSSRPGVMMYFDIRPCLKRLNNEQKGQLFEAILDYAEFSVVPDFGDDVGLSIAWDFIQPKIDRDNERYEAQVLQKRYAVVVRECKRNGQTAPPFEVWKQNPQQAPGDMESHHPLSGDDGCYPTTTTTTTPSTTTTPTSKATATWPPPGDFNSRRNAWLDALEGIGDSGPYQPINTDERRGPL